MFTKEFGGSLTTKWKQTYATSPNWKEGKFQNQFPTQTAIQFSKLPKMLWKQFKGRADSEPNKPLPILPFYETEFLGESSTANCVWYGHSVVLLRMNGLTLLIDPMLGPDAAPIAPFATKRFSDNSLSIIEQLPSIDAVLITHDHYDHLDYKSIQLLQQKTKQFLVALGVQRHLEAWGIKAEQITEFDWWDYTKLQDVTITFTPTKHFSGRGLGSMAKCLWGGWAIQSNQESIWFSGDGGYDKHFATIGEQLGPFDLAFMECGQYGSDWPDIHLFPQEAVRSSRCKSKNSCTSTLGGL